MSQAAQDQGQDQLQLPSRRLSREENKRWLRAARATLLTGSMDHPPIDEAHPVAQSLLEDMAKAG